MPELPEVETVARGLRDTLTGRVIRSVEVGHASMFQTNPEELLQLKGACVRGIERAGKYLLLDVTRNQRHWKLMIHLGMTGKLLLIPAETPRAKHTHLIFELENSNDLRLIDPRRFGRVALAEITTAEPQAVLQALGVAPGIEPLEVSEEDFLTMFQKRDAPIKNLLLNQSLLRGLGNIYADESLFRAGIHPQAKRVSRPRLRRLREQIRQVLREAIDAGGSSVSDYVHSDGQRGWFQVQHRVYGKEGEPCVACSRPIRRLVLAGRSAHYCPTCQRW